MRGSSNPADSLSRREYPPTPVNLTDEIYDQISCISDSYFPAKSEEQPSLHIKQARNESSPALHIVGDNRTMGDNSTMNEPRTLDNIQATSTLADTRTLAYTPPTTPMAEPRILAYTPP